jgi:hypothetical protein
MSSPEERYVAGLVDELTDDDFNLDEVPAGLWERIEATVAEPSVVTPLAPRRRRWAPIVAVAAAVLAVLVVAGAVIRTGSTADVELARARLTSEGLTRSSDLVGGARLVEVGGRREIDLDLPGLAEGPDSFYELWLLAPDATRLQSLGVTDGHGRFLLPESIDPHQYPVVDVSREPPDGNPAHSGDSLVRGRLDL